MKYWFLTIEWTRVRELDSNRENVVHASETMVDAITYFTAQAREENSPYSSLVVLWYVEITHEEYEKIKETVE